MILPDLPDEAAAEHTAQRIIAAVGEPLPLQGPAHAAWAPP
ncbi:MAG: hypothetical protein U5L74_12215 [Ideonella sp.]|nr:hypothetical protein [Ideonella sp.]